MHEYVVGLPSRVSKKADPRVGKRLYSGREHAGGVELKRSRHLEAAKAGLEFCALWYGVRFTDKSRSLMSGDYRREFVFLPIEIGCATRQTGKRIIVIQKYEFKF